MDEEALRVDIPPAIDGARVERIFGGTKGTIIV